MDDPFRTFDDLRSTFIRYLDSPFRLRYQALLEERRALIDRDRHLYREPLFEPIAPYISSGLSMDAACAALGVNSEVAEFVSQKLLPGGRELYSHQLDAWADSRQGKAVVVTSGTGSGKTECYLIPVFASLVEESARWSTSSTPPNDYWWNTRRGRVSQRAFEDGVRSPALRALFLYPLNALIEDQLGRIREACDSPSIRTWLNHKRGANRFWFGRYTSATPVSGSRHSVNKRSELKRRLKYMELQWGRATASSAASADPGVLNYFQDPSGSEMWSRWDMQEHPPDILITNYSMLNIMLMREIEDPIFDQTSEWLAQDRSNNTFHLVVDELHSYRGTPGTEVGYLLRAFLGRIGLEPDSPQLRIIATSASIGGDPKSRKYLREFFGRDPDSFSVIPGVRRSFEGGGPLSSVAGRLVAAGRSLDTGIGAALQELGISCGSREGAPTALVDWLESSGCLEAVRRLGEDAPFSVRDLAERAFSGSADAESAAKAMLRLVVLARTQNGAPLPIRVHYFFHNVGRLWACVNPSCSGRMGRTQVGELPPVGRMYTEPQPKCESCHGAVLELLYCQPCGEVFLGGFHRSDLDMPNTWYLSPDFPDLNRVPDKVASLKRSFGEYMVFWPAMGRGLAKTTQGQKWKWQQDGTPEWMWTPATLDHQLAQLTRPQRVQTNQPGVTAGYLFLAPQGEADAFPSKCPHCGADWAKRRVGSPIRDLGSGFQRVVQLLNDALMRGLEPGSRKLVLFSDSRQDAAKLSTGIKRAHYLDTVRQIAFSHLAQAGRTATQRHNQAVADYQSSQEFADLLLKQNRTETEQARFRFLLRSLPQDLSGAMLFELASTGGITRPPKPEPVRGFASADFNSLIDSVRSNLLDIGVNPGGPMPSVSSYQPNVRNQEAVQWPDLFDWTTTPKRYKSGLQPIPEALRDRIEVSLKMELVRSVLFADGSRDFESLNLGFLWIDGTAPDSIEDQAVASVLRILGQRQRWDGSDAEGQPSPPGYVSRFLEAAEDINQLPSGSLLNHVASRLGTRLDQWIVKMEGLHVLAPIADPNNMVLSYRCARCGKAHLHPSAGVCTTCLRQLPPAPRQISISSPAEDFYEFLAKSEVSPFRLQAEELTGQTNNEDRTSRQRRFQDVFMEDERPDTAGVDLLSVTTTMEAGVDIGALQVIALANMPPVRFNYQQRVGRAGRRGLGMSAALTLCRGRSHDDYYFERPQLITAEPPPVPYVDVSRKEIARRVIQKEMLKRAFTGLDVSTGGDNVHGEFGTVDGPDDGWRLNRESVIDWIARSQDEIVSICRTILRRTNFDSPQSIGELASEISRQLVGLIDRVAEDPESRPHSALSERLASWGVLPMFGFPTRARLLFHESPRLTFGWPPSRGVTDRELDIAISQFAPGAQTVKDDKLFTAVGVVDYRPSGFKVVAAPEPLGNTVTIGVCRRCQALVEDPSISGACPYCSATRSPGGYRTVDITEPPGFTTWFSIDAEFTGGFEFTPRALRARIGSSPGETSTSGNFTLNSGSQRVFRINDNAGSDFNFEKVAGQHVWITQDAFDQALKDLPSNGRSTISKPRFESSVPARKLALASISTTDVLAIGIGEAPIGLNLNPAIPEARAAWYSYGFLVRRAAAVSLDVAEAELDLGMQPIADFRTPFAPPSAKVFLSDALENGAGYCTHLGEPVRFRELLEFILGVGPQPNRRFIDPLVDALHEVECASSCHRCLREFGNMAYHPLLDWRTGLDMARLSLDRTAAIDLNAQYWSNLLDRLVEPYFRSLDLSPATLGGLNAGINGSNNQALVLVHPMWDTDRANLCRDAAAAVAEGEAEGLNVTLKSVLRAVRFPYE